MPFFPSSSNIPPPASNDTAFDVTLTTVAVSQDLVVAPAGEKIRSFELRNDGPGAAYVEASGVAAAPATSTKVKNGESYSKDDISIDKLTFVGEATKKPNLVGVAWSS